MAKKKKNYNPYKIKSKSSYTVKEIAELYGFHPRTIQEWIKKGLKVLNPNSSPYLIIGETVREFLREMRRRKKHPLESDEFYCTKCRRKTKSKKEKLCKETTNRNLGKNSKQVIIKGNCEVCNNLLFKFSSTRIIEELAKKGMAFKEFHKGLNETRNHSLNTDIEKEEKCQILTFKT